MPCRPSSVCTGWKPVPCFWGSLPPKESLAVCPGSRPRLLPLPGLYAAGSLHCGVVFRKKSSLTALHCWTASPLMSLRCPVVLWGKVTGLYINGKWQFYCEVRGPVMLSYKIIQLIESPPPQASFYLGGLWYIVYAYCLFISLVNCGCICKRWGVLGNILGCYTKKLNYIISV